MVVTPLGDDDVFASVLHHVGAFIVVAALVLQSYLVAWPFGAVDAHVENVGAWTVNK